MIQRLLNLFFATFAPQGSNPIPSGTCGLYADSSKDAYWYNGTSATKLNTGGGGTRTLVRATFLSSDATKNVTWTAVGGSGYRIIGLNATDASGATPPIPFIAASTDGTATIGVNDLFTNGGTVDFEVVSV